MNKYIIEEEIGWNNSTTYKVKRDGEYRSIASYSDIKDAEDYIKELEESDKRVEQERIRQRAEREEQERQEKLQERREKQKLIWGIVGVVFIVVVLFLGITGLYKVDPGQQAVVVNRLDGTTELVEEVGFGWEAPFVNKVSKITTAETVYDHSDTANTSDAIQTTFNGKVTYVVNDVEAFYNKKYTTDQEAVQSVINTNLTKALDTVANKYSYEEIKSNVAQFSTEVVNAVNPMIADYGIEVVQYSITGLVVPESIQASLDKKVTDEQNAKAKTAAAEENLKTEQAQTAAAEEEAKQQEIKEESGSQSQGALCQQAIAAGQTQSPACYFGEGDFTVGVPVTEAQ